MAWYNNSFRDPISNYPREKATRRGVEELAIFHHQSSFKPYRAAFSSARGKGVSRFRIPARNSKLDISSVLMVNRCTLCFAFSSPFFIFRFPPPPPLRRVQRAVGKNREREIEREEKIYTYIYRGRRKTDDGDAFR